jgi:hypothetical protein
VTGGCDGGQGAEAVEPGNQETKTEEGFREEIGQ